MPAAAFTQKLIASLRSDGTNQQYYDTRVRGLILRVSPKGDRLSWSIVYVGEKGKKQRTTLRGSDAADLDAARNAARRIIGQVAEGRDLAAEKRQTKSAITVGDVLDRYVANKLPELRSGGEAKRRLNAFVRPALGTIKAVDLERETITKMTDAIKGGRPVANGVIASRNHASL